MKKLSLCIAALVAVSLAFYSSCSKEKSPIGPGNDTYSLTGKVLENSSGLSGVSVHLTGAGRDTTATADSTGAYTFTGLANGTYTLTPSKNGYTFSSSNKTVTLYNANVFAPDIIANSSTPVYTITGRILESGSGISGISVRLIGEGMDVTAVTDFTGAYTFTGIPNGMYTLTPFKSGYVFTPPSQTATVMNAYASASDIIAAKSSIPTYIITGRVLDSGIGVPGVSVHLTGFAVDTTTTTDSVGTYTFTDLWNGSYTLSPYKSGYSFTPANTTLIKSDMNAYAPDITAIHIGKDIGKDITFIAIPGGTFQMGDVEWAGYSDEKPVHTVTISEFEMSKYEITNAQYANFLNVARASGDVTAMFIKYMNEPASLYYVNGTKGIYNGKVYINCDRSIDAINKSWIVFNDGKFSVVPGHENWPVVYVSWYGAKAYALYCGLDLPTEAEWEYACRGGRQYKYGTDDGTISSSKANFGSNFGHPVDVGSYPNNPYGLYDMSGNVWEWCHDWYGSYTSESITNPAGAFSGSSRVVRGGSTFYLDVDCRSAIRSKYDPGWSGSFIGFRVVRRISPQNY